MKRKWAAILIVGVVAILIIFWLSYEREFYSQPKAVRISRERLWNTEYTINRFFRLVDTNCLTPSYVVRVEGKDFQTITWPVPEPGYIALLDEEPNRHDPNKRLLRLVAFISRDYDRVQFVTNTNAIMEDISLQMSDGTVTTNLSWAQF